MAERESGQEGRVHRREHRGTFRPLADQPTPPLRIREALGLDPLLVFVGDLEASPSLVGFDPGGEGDQLSAANPHRLEGGEGLQAVVASADRRPPGRCSASRWRRDGYRAAQHLAWRVPDVAVSSTARVWPLDDVRRFLEATKEFGSIAILQDRAAHDSRGVIDQLQRALNTRVVIEQAKGLVAQSSNLKMDQAFDRIRGYSRDHNLRLSQVAGDLVAGKIDPNILASPVSESRQPL